MKKREKDSEKKAPRNKAQQEEGSTFLNMPEVKDIPGQEHIHPPRIREMEDTTAASADEEGAGLLDDLNTSDQSVVTNTSNVSREERRMLQQSAGHAQTEESREYNRTVLDDRDDDGELLNEKSSRQDRMGEDLDVPGSELDDDNENIGEEDEENNIYSQSQKDSQ